MRACVSLLLTLPALALALPACTKQPPPPEVHVQAQASPTPTPLRNDDTDAVADRLKRKTGEAAAAINAYLKQNRPGLENKFQRLGDKFARDKDVWRKKLLAEKQQLQPQIDALKQKAGKVDEKARVEIDKQAAALEQQSDNADQKLAELESATADGWKAFKQKLKAEDSTPPAATPTPADGQMPATPTPLP